MRGETLRIVLADPNRPSREGLRSQLQHAGFHVDSVASGSDVLLLCRTDPPDVLIMDLSLRDIDGFELCARVRRETRDTDTVVIIMTEPTDEMTRTYLGQMVDFAGGDYFFVRPFDGRLLVHLLDDLGKERGGMGNHVRVAFPTRVVWPTARTQRLVPVG